MVQAVAFTFYFYNIESYFQTRRFCAILLSNTVILTVTSFQALKTLPQNKEEVQVSLSVKWSGVAPPQKCKVELEKVLQTWANSIDEFNGDCTVLKVSKDGSVVISLKPAPGKV